MADDPARLSAMRRAIDAAVRPGMSVADVGCGLGTFTVLACRAGARVVWAIDADPILEVAAEVARANGCAGRVRLLSGSSTALEVPERVDVALFEDFESGLLSSRVVATLADLRARWLAPGGRLVPSRARRLAALVEDVAGHVDLEVHAAAGQQVEGVDLSPARDRAMSSAHIRRLPRTALLTRASVLDEVELDRVTSPAVRSGATHAPERSGIAHGVAVWFELELAGQWLSTGPGSATAWSQLLLPLDPPLPVSPLVPVSVEVEAHAIAGVLHWRWLVASGSEVRASDTLAGEPLTIGLQGGAHLAVPRLDEEVEIDRAVLGAVDGRSNVTTIATLLRERFPRHFPDAPTAAARVLSLLARYVP